MFVIIAVLLTLNPVSPYVLTKTNPPNPVTTGNTTTTTSTTGTGTDDRVDFLPVNVTQYAGFVPVNASNLFYWFFESQSAVKAYPSSSTDQGGKTKHADQSQSQTNTDIPIMVWLNGGPGASSLFGCFGELGPIKLDSSGAPIENPESWNRNLHLLFWDQPVGTGFSYTTDQKTGYMTDEDGVSEQFYMALQGFFGRHPEYLSNPLYIAGESYAGKYIPYMANQILFHNAAGRTPILNLQGISIGNGWMDPVIQHRVAIDFGFAMGLIDTKQKKRAKEMYASCLPLLESGRFAEADQVCGSGGGGNGQDGIMGYILNSGGNPDIYDVREFSDGFDSAAIGKYLNSDYVRQQLRVGDHRWVAADGTSIVAKSLINDLQRPNTFLFPNLFNQLPQVLFYTGLFDMSCGYQGTEEILYNLEWSGQQEWQALDRFVWRDPATNVTAGTVKQLGGLTQVAVPRAGHLVPLNRPKFSRMMIENFVFKQAW